MIEMLAPWQLLFYSFECPHTVSIGPQQHTWSALVGNKKVLVSEGTGVLPKHWTEYRDATRPAILTFWEHFLQGWENMLWLYICCVSHEKFEEYRVLFWKQKAISHSHSPSHCGLIYLDSNWGSAFCVLLLSYIWVCRRAHMLFGNTSSIESW